MKELENIFSFIVNAPTETLMALIMMGCLFVIWNCLKIVDKSINKND